MRSGFLGFGKKNASGETDPYDSFASVYDRWQALYTRPFSLAMTIRMQQAWDEFGVPEQSLLDFACGTGTLAWWWSHHYPAWNVVGVDRSAPMIERARRRDGGEASSGTQQPSFHTGDISRLSPSDLDRDSGFGMVTCFFDSLNHITKTKELEGALRSARRCLLPGGLFVFDLIDDECFPEIFGSPWIVQSDHLYVGCESEYFERRGASYGRVHFTFFERNGDGSGEAGTGDTDRHARDASGPGSRRSRRTSHQIHGQSGGTAEPNSWKRSETEILERAWPREVFDPMVDDAGLEIIHVQLIDPEEQPDVFVPRRLYVCRPKN